MKSDVAKVVLVIAVAIGILIVFGVMRDRGKTATEAPSVEPTVAQSAEPAPTTTEPIQSLTATPDASDSDRPDWAPVVIGFGRAFTATKATRTEWLAALTPYSDPQATRALEGYDRAQIPAQSFDGYEQLDSDSGQLAVQLNYAEGWLLIVYLTHDKNTWLVSAFDQLEQ